LDESNKQAVLIVEVPVANRRRHEGNLRGTLSDYSNILAQLGSLKAEGSSNTVRIIKTK